MYLSNALSRCRFFMPLAVFCALTASLVAQAGLGEPDQPAVKGAVKELFRTKAPISGFYAISPDSRKLAFGQVVRDAEGKPSRGELVLVDLATGKELGRRRVDSPVYGGVFSPDGKLLAIGSPSFFQKKCATVWDVASWEPKVQLKVPEGHGVGCPLAFSPDGNLLAGRAARATRKKSDPWPTADLILWDVATGDCRVLEDPEARRVRPNEHQGFRVSGFHFVDKEGKETYYDSRPIVGRVPMAISLPDPPCADQLFVEYHDPVLTTLWDTTRGKALRTDLYGGNLPWDGSQRSLAGRGAPLPGSKADLYRFRTTPSGRILRMPKYHPPPVIGLAHDDGTITLAVTPIERNFGTHDLSPGSRLTELCRLEDYKVRNPADRGITSRKFRLSPDGRWLVALGTDPATVKTKNPVRVLRVWDVSALHPVALKKMQQHKLAGAERERLWSVLFEDQPEVKGLLEGLTFPYRWYEEGLQAMYSLVLHGDDGVAWLRQQMGPPFDRKQLPRLIADLDSPDFPTRQRASLRLEQLGPLARSALESTLKKGPPPETKRRAELLLARLQGTEAAYELRQLRIIDVLEHIHRPAARELLQAIADGSYDPAFAEEAKKALRRATEKAKEKP